MGSSLPLMRFKTFVWPNNPKTIEVVHKGIMSEESKKSGEIDRFIRIVRGEGEFFGHSAVNSYKKLSDLIHEKSSGWLYLPGVARFEAVFSKVSLVGEPGPDVLRYSFEFQEIVKTFDGELDKKYYDVDSDTSLWEIANIFEVKVEKLIELNPEIKNPSFIKGGERIRIR